jgi:hypothetical protein
MGWGTLLTQNLAQDFGRRPVLLVGMLGSSLLQTHVEASVMGKVDIRNAKLDQGFLGGNENAK